MLNSGFQLSITVTAMHSVDRYRIYFLEDTHRFINPKVIFQGDYPHWA